MSYCNDLRDYIDRLEERGEIIFVEDEMDPLNFELSSVIRHSEDAANRAVYFERVKGYNMSVVANLFGSIRRCAIGCGILPTPQEIQRYRNDPHGGPGAFGGSSIDAFTMDAEERTMMAMMRERILEADGLAAQGKFGVRLVDTGPCKDVIIRDNIDLPAMLPVPWHCQGDVGPFINPGAMIQRDPDSGVLNAGVRRHQVTYKGYGPKRMGVFMTSATDGYRIWSKYEERNQPCPVALCIGLDPITEIMANFSSAHFANNLDYSEFDVAGAMRRDPLEMVRCETVDLVVPATSEIVIEGYIPPKERIYEGPMAEFTDMYAQKGPLPFIEVTAITHRRNPIFHTLMSGRSEEHRVLGVFSCIGREQKMLASIQRAFPSVKDVAIFAGSHNFHLVVSLKQRFDGEDKMLLHYLLSTVLHKYITVVDDDIEPHNSEQVEWARAMRAGANPDDFLVFPHTHTRELDPERDENYCVTRLGVLATLPFGQRYERTGPPPEMLNNTRPVFERASTRRRVKV